MRAAYISRFSKADSITVASVSMPILERKRIKNEFKEITKEPVSFSSITYDNVKTSYMLSKLFFKEPMTATVSHVTKYKSSSYCKAVFSAVLSEYEKHGREEMRVYIPFNKDKTALKDLNKMAASKKKPIIFEEIRYNESCFQQLANLFAGCVNYRRDDENYFNNLGQTPEAQLTAYIYSAKKDKGKFDINDFVASVRKRNSK